MLWGRVGGVRGEAWSASEHRELHQCVAAIVSQQSELYVAVRSCDTSATQALEKKQLIAAGKLGKFGRPLEGSSVTASQ